MIYSHHILNQVKKEDKIEYKFYSDYRDFEKEIKKELNLETVTDNNNGENIINFLLEKGNNYKKSKEITINDKDFLREDFLGSLLREYKSCKDYLNELKKTGTAKEKYYCNKNITSINNDMLYCKEHIDGIFGTNLRNALSDSECPDFDGIDFSNLHHISTAGCHCSLTVRGCPLLVACCDKSPPSVLVSALLLATRWTVCNSHTVRPPSHTRTR